MKHQFLEGSDVLVMPGHGRALWSCSRCAACSTWIRVTAWSEFPQVFLTAPFVVINPLPVSGWLKAPKDPAHQWPLWMCRSAGSEATRPRRCAVRADSTVPGSEQCGLYGAGTGGLWLRLSPLS